MPIEQSTYRIRPMTVLDIPECQTLFRSTVLIVNSKDYTKEEVSDWASCGDSIEHWKELFAKNNYIGALDEQDGIIGFSSMNTEGYLTPCLSTKTGNIKAWQAYCFQRLKRWLMDMACIK